ncbi:MAG: alpha/beta hydrolase [Acidobacteriota bacterium]|nr:alpha/beta hydrolase [Acidobacteriota bacterium]
MTTGATLAHRVDGDGEPLLLLNGGMMTHASWEPIAVRLQERYTVVRCDLRGQLLSPGSVSPDMSSNVGDLTDLLDHLGLESAHVLGTSYGGEIGLLLAALAPERVRSLIAVTVTDRTTDAMRRGAQDLRQLIASALAGGDRGLVHDRLVTEAYSARHTSRFGDSLAGRRELVARLPDAWFEGLEGIIASMETLDLRSYLSSIACPTLVIIAADDRVIPPVRSRELAAAIGGAEVSVHPTSGHALVVEDPDWVTDAALEFLKRQSQSAAVASEIISND